jgi:macrolide-specific efflux system membrane fusion protein
MAKKKRFSTRRSRVTLSIVCIVVIAVVAFFVYRAYSGDDTATVTYTTGTVQKMTLTTSVSGTGNISLPNTESVNPSISGKVADLSVKLGDTVKKGDVLFTLYNPQLDVDVANAQIAYDKAVLAVDQARTSLVSAKTSQASTYRSTAGVVSGQQATAAVTTATLEVESAETAVKSAEITLQDAEDNAAARTVTAGMDGVITTMSIENGDSLAGGTASASAPVVITDPSVYEATVTIAESDISSVEVGQKATLAFDSLTDVNLSGTVTRVDTVGTNSSGVVSYSAVITPDVMESAVKSGMTVTATIITDTAADVLAVPSTAVKSSNGGSYVQILQNGVPSNVTVKTGLSGDSYIEITSGLTEGQEIVVSSTTASKSGSTTTTARNQGNTFQGGGMIIESTGGGGMPPSGGGSFGPPGQ